MAQLAYYIYYRVAPGVDAAARNQVQAAQAEIDRATGSSARLLMKRGEPALWMEVYEGVTDPVAFERTLAAAVERHGLVKILRPGSGRRIECFVAPECA